MNKIRLQMRNNEVTGDEINIKAGKKSSDDRAEKNSLVLDIHINAPNLKADHISSRDLTSALAKQISKNWPDKRITIERGKDMYSFAARDIAIFCEEGSKKLVVALILCGLASDAGDLLAGAGTLLSGVADVIEATKKDSRNQCQELIRDSLGNIEISVESADKRVGEYTIEQINISKLVSYENATNYLDMRYETSGEHSGKDKYVIFLSRNTPNEKFKQKPHFSEVWKRIQKHEGEVFRTFRGSEFTYKTSDSRRQFRTERYISKGKFKKAYMQWPVRRPTYLIDVFQPSYVWAVLNDKRILPD